MIPADFAETKTAAMGRPWSDNRATLDWRFLK
jgi:hypothetical protein